MTRTLLAAACALSVSTAAYADGVGVVTEMVSGGPSYPYAELYYTNGQNQAQGGQAYCFLTTDPGYEGMLRNESMSYATKNYAVNQETLIFQLGSSSSLCPTGSARVVRLQLGQ